MFLFFIWIGLGFFGVDQMPLKRSFFFCLVLGIVLQFTGGNHGRPDV